jgi:parallel beta-helix repeat protein
MKKIIIIILIILLFNSLIIFSSVGLCEEINGNTLYVGGSGDGNFSIIQDAIEEANNNDTVYVYNGTYSENITINKSINLRGENKNNTIIYSEKNEYIFIKTNFINITEFTIINGIIIDGSYNMITKNIFFGNVTEIGSGIRIKGNNNIISKNSISNFDSGIYTLNSNYNNIIQNEITNSSFSGIALYERSKENKIINNTIDNNNYGIYIHYSPENIITGNIISNDNIGIDVIYSPNCDIFKNTYLNNKEDISYSGETNIFTMLIIGLIVSIIFLLPIAIYWRKKYFIK